MIRRSILLIASALALLGNAEGCEQRLLMLRRGAIDKTPTAASSQFAAPQEQSQNTIRAGTGTARCERMIYTPPRGLSCLHCMQPEAREQAYELLAIMSDACVENVAVNFIADGSFGFDPDFIAEAISILGAGGSRVFAYAYLLNGPSQRRYSSTPVAGMATQISPEEFREAIFHDRALRSTLQRHVRELVPVIVGAQQGGHMMALVLGLEDNFDSETVAEVERLVREALPPTLSVPIGRNPCADCYSGNDDDIPLGLFAEVHTTSVSEASDLYRGVVSNDGRPYYFPGETPLEDAPSLADLETLRDASAESAFILWTSKYQGLGAKMRGMGTAPAERPYEMPSARERSMLIRFLRGEPL